MTTFCMAWHGMLCLASFLFSISRFSLLLFLWDNQADSCVPISTSFRPKCYLQPFAGFLLGFLPLAVAEEGKRIEVVIVMHVLSAFDGWRRDELRRAIGGKGAGQERGQERKGMDGIRDGLFVPVGRNGKRFGRVRRGVGEVSCFV